MAKANSIHLINSIEENYADQTKMITTDQSDRALDFVISGPVLHKLRTCPTFGNALHILICH